MGKITIDKTDNRRLSHLTNEDDFFALSLSDDIKNLASPLHTFGITYFNQIRIFKDGSRISIGTHAEWLAHFFNNKYYLKGRFSKKGSGIKENNAVLWKLQSEDGVSHDARTHFNIDNGFTIIKHTHEYNDFFLFASTPEHHQVNEFYVSQRDLLEKFIAYFQEKSELFINQCTPDKPEFFDDAPTETEIIDEKIHEQIITFNNVVNPKQFFIYHDGKKVTITPTEYIFLQSLICDKTIKEIAQIMNIKPSTCYRHIENLKIKLNLSSTAQLITIAKKNYG